MGVCFLMLLLFEGVSLRRSAEQLQPGWQRTMVLAVAKPSELASNKSGLHRVKQELVSWARPVDALPAAPASITVESKRQEEGSLGTLLITGDSMAQPLDAKIARKFTASGSGVRVVNDVHLGTAISQPQLLDWTKEAVRQKRKWSPGAVVVFLGANEGFPLTDAGGNTVECCGAAWVAEYSRRVGLMVDAWSSSGNPSVYWLSLPAPRDNDRREISKAVNSAVVIAAKERPGQVRVVDLFGLFTPQGQFRSSMDVDGRPTVVREPDGIHLNEAGADLASDPVLAALRSKFGSQVPK